METVLVETCKSGRTAGDDCQVGRHFVRFLMDFSEKARYRRTIRIIKDVYGFCSRSHDQVISDERS